MRALLFAAMSSAWILPLSAPAAEVSEADRNAIDGVISAQIEAFRHDDGAAALRFATPGLQRQFGDGAHFLDIVREDYPAMVRPRSISFGDSDVAEGIVIQKVILVGPEGVPATARYEMQHGPDGTWRIAGCSLVRSAQSQI